MSEQTISLPIGMGSTKCIEDLPNDVLVEIFAYLSFKELIQSVQQVSTRWHAVAQDSHLWRKREYSPTYKDTAEDIVKILQQIPNLGTLNLEEICVGSSVLCACLENCYGVRNLKFNIDQRFCYKAVKSLVHNCLKLEVLTIPDKVVRRLETAQLIAQLQKLKTLNVVGLEYFPQPVLLRPIGDGCPLLQHLDIQHQVLNTADLKYFMQLKQHQLQSIKVRCTTVDGNCTIPHLTVCKTLKKVVIEQLCDVQITAGFESLKGLKNVTALNFSMIQHFDVDSLVNLFKNKQMYHLIELKFDFYLAYEDELSATICNNCPQLKFLGFKDCVLMTDRSLENLPKLKGLEYLHLGGCREITDNGMEFVFKCKHLKYLNLFDCNRLTEQCMKQITGLNLIETLKLDFCNIEGLPLNQIPTLLTKLRFLSVNFCQGVNLGGLDQLRAEMPHLRLCADWMDNYDQYIY